jgi:hypothetical protein
VIPLRGLFISWNITNRCRTDRKNKCSLLHKEIIKKQKSNKKRKSNIISSIASFSFILETNSSNLKEEGP